MTDIYRILGWVVPTLCLVVAGGVIFNRHTAFLAANMDRVRAEAELESASAEKAKVDRAPSERRYAAAEAGPLEETQFLDDLRLRAHRTGATLSNWTSKATVYGDAPAGTPGDATKVELLKGVTRVDCDLTISGSYGSLRRFVKDLSDSDRLFTLKNINWNRIEGGTTSLSMSVGRYVAPAGLAPAPPTLGIKTTPAS